MANFADSARLATEETFARQLSIISHRPDAIPDANTTVSKHRSSFALITLANSHYIYYEV